METLFWRAAEIKWEVASTISVCLVDYAEKGSKVFTMINFVPSGNQSLEQQTWQEHKYSTNHKLSMLWATNIQPILKVDIRFSDKTRAIAFTLK